MLQYLRQDVAAPLLAVPPEGANAPAAASDAQLRLIVSSAADLRTRSAGSRPWMGRSPVLRCCCGFS